MDYSNFIWSTTTFIETRLKEQIRYSELEKTLGFSYRHIRETFKECTGISMSRYILQRRLANSAFEIIHTGKSLTEIATEYMFENYDTFTRAFKRGTDHLPSQVRSSSCSISVGRKRIAIGIFAPVIIKERKNISLPSGIWKDDNDMTSMCKTEESCILYGVPKVAYSCGECTPFCVALKACLNYMGQQIDYSYIMAATGASFRLRWNMAYWDGGNVDIRNIYEDSYEVFRKAFQAAGRSYRILKRRDSHKQGFIEVIKSEIDEGRPVIALGIIGPPEACLITGYRDKGETLLGWNCFQDNQEFAKDVEQDETGYFITKSWWENEMTTALISVGEKQEECADIRGILNQAIELLTKDKIEVNREDRATPEVYAGGQKAYELWAEAIRGDRELSPNAVLQILFERLMCQNDAQDMVGEGRAYAARFIEWIGREYPSVAEQCKRAAGYFRQAADYAYRMNELKGGFELNEQTAKQFADPRVRREIAVLIDRARENEAKAVICLLEVAKQLE